MSAVDDGRAEAGGTFKKAKVVKEVGVAGDKGPIKTVVNTKKSNDNNSNEPSLAEKMSKAAQDRQKQANKFTASKIADYKKTGRATGFKEGGLMKGKK